MIRMILGQLEESYAHPNAAGEVRCVLDAKDNRLAAHPAAPGGLYLEEIVYAE
jgi:tRNA U38,U39,U40 pseudouridine synthase TruA